mmetsp:Transcript_4485/g.10918  ORF Transcript_4485/g.10918 Transcript_4485/m.10918 type:complete len:498 (-) Transcript_4485:88-1581(-)
MQSPSTVLACEALGDNFARGGKGIGCTGNDAPPGGSPPLRPARVRQSSFGDDEELVNELPPSWTLQQFQAEVTSVLKEFFLSRALEEAAARVEELLTECPGEADEFGVVAIRAALDRDEVAQSAVVELLGKLYQSSVLETSAVVRTFEKLFCTWEDIAIDAPKAPEVLLGILMGCVEGGIVNRSLLTKLPENLMKAGLSKASSISGHEILAEVAADIKEFKLQASHCLDEYFLNLSVDEVTSRLKEIGMKPYQHELVKKAITTSFSRQDEGGARECILNLFQHLTNSGALSKDDLQWGITRLLGQLDDLELDCPRAAELTIEFLTCMVADELVSVPFLRRCRSLRIGGPTGLRVIDAAQRKTPEYCKKHLGTTQFKRELNTMILEYFNSGDEAEFGRCVRDLAPLTNERSAELIRKVMALAMERSGAECEQALKLLVWLCRHEELSADAFELGFDELYKRMPDLLLDVPDAHEMAQAFVVEAKKANVLRREWASPDV